MVKNTPKKAARTSGPVVHYSFQADKGTSSMLGAVTGRTWKEAWRSAAKKATEYGYVLWCIFPMAAPSREIRRSWERVQMKIKARAALKLAQEVK